MRDYPDERPTRGEIILMKDYPDERPPWLETILMRDYPDETERPPWGETTPLFKATLSWKLPIIFPSKIKWSSDQLQPFFQGRFHLSFVSSWVILKEDFHHTTIFFFLKIENLYQLPLNFALTSYIQHLNWKVPLIFTFKLTCDWKNNNNKKHDKLNVD